MDLSLMAAIVVGLVVFRVAEGIAKKVAEIAVAAIIVYFAIKYGPSLYDYLISNPDDVFGDLMKLISVAIDSVKAFVTDFLTNVIA